MLVAIVGSRSIFPDDDTIFWNMPDQTTKIISGGAKGVDSCAERCANNFGFKFLAVLPDYPVHGRKAPLIRNQEIINKCNYVLAFWNGKSSGTGHTINLAKKAGLPVRVVKVNQSGQLPLFGGLPGLKK